MANKFQTGFDQPLLCGMYVDKRLAGIQAVQTLSRLNRAHPGKDTTYVLDFVNDAEDVLEAFKTYYTTAELANVTDPNLVYDLRAKLDAAGHYDDFEVDRVVDVELKPKAKQSDLCAAAGARRGPAAEARTRRARGPEAAQAEKDAKRARRRPRNELDALLLFKRDMGAFLRLYTFLSQIFDYGNTAMEKRSIFYKRLLPLLEFGRERESDRPVEGGADAPSPEEPGKPPTSMFAATAREAGADHRGRCRPGERKPGWNGDHRPRQRPVRRRADRRRQAGLREQRDQGEAPGVRDSESSRRPITPRSSSPTPRTSPARS